MNNAYVLLSGDTCRRYRGKFIALDSWIDAGVIAAGATMLELETELAMRGVLLGDVVILRVAEAKTQVYVV